MVTESLIWRYQVPMWSDSTTKNTRLRLFAVKLYHPVGFTTFFSIRWLVDYMPFCLVVLIIRMISAAKLLRCFVEMPDNKFYRCRVLFSLPETKAHKRPIICTGSALDREFMAIAAIINRTTAFVASQSRCLRVWCLLEFLKALHFAQPS